MFVHHLWWFYKETDGCINDYAMEGAEKLNDIIKKHYSRNTNKKSASMSLFQTIHKQGRCEINRLKRSNTFLKPHKPSKYARIENMLTVASVDSERLPAAARPNEFTK